MEWKKISTAPKNKEGEGVGPYILVFSNWDHGTYTARWECHGEKGSWRFIGRKPGPWSSESSVTHWMDRPEMPWVQERNK